MLSTRRHHHLERKLQTSLLLAIAFLLTVLKVVPVQAAPSQQDTAGPTGAPTLQTLVVEQAAITPLPAKFETGGALIQCEGKCVESWKISKKEVKALIDNQQWREAVSLVMRTAVKQDLPYLYLGKAAQELGFNGAARQYYETAKYFAKNPAVRCVDSLDGCDGIDVFLQASLALQRLPQPVPDLEQISVPQYIWNGLSEAQKKAFSKRYTAIVLDPKSYGTVIDAQGQNESTAATRSGQAIGSALGSAAYFDNSFRSGNYSAVGHVAAGLLGGVIGSATDKAAVPIFRTRYTVRTIQNTVEYVEDVTSSTFRHSVGLCVGLSPFRLLDLDICGQTRQQFLSKYISILPKDFSVELAPTASDETPVTEVYCKFVTVPIPVKLPKSVCESAGGTILR